MIFANSDTIAAISTAKGIGAIAVVRLSGIKSFTIADKIFRAKKSVKELGHSMAIHGHIYFPQTNEILDKVILTKFSSPFSFTGDDMIEISCHGGIYIVNEIMNLLLENGARLAAPGEFTKRAFINGKMDLVQAESVADIINAQTKESLKLSSYQLEGILSEKLGYIAEELKKQYMLLEVELDFSEEELEFADRKHILTNVDNLLVEVDKLLSSFKYGRLVRQGVNIVIVGRPNVGKSSIMNRLLDEERAIVTEVPGTTRDSLEESIDIEGILFNITDTAGLRETTDIVEKEGISKTNKKISQADIILYVLDINEALNKKDVDKFCELKKTKTIVPIFNKTDLCSDLKKVVFGDEKKDVKLSAKTGFGFDFLQEKLLSLVTSEKPVDAQILTNTRHRNILDQTKNFLLHVKKSLKANLPSEFIAADLKSALDTIGELTGQVTTEDILNEIFSEFCVGK
jgi:tRNA modification GTPase